MKTPASFDAVPAIVVAEPLAEALGAAEGGDTGALWSAAKAQHE